MNKGLTDSIEFLKTSEHSVEAVILQSPKERPQPGVWADLLDTCSRCHIRVFWAAKKHARSLYDNADTWFFREAEKRQLETQEGGGGQGRESGSHRRVR